LLSTFLTTFYEPYLLTVWKNCNSINNSYIENMIEYIEDAPDIKIRPAVEEQLTEYIHEVRELLPELSNSLQFWLSNKFLIPETGTGGFSYSPEIISLSFDPAFPDKEGQRRDFRGTVFHEAYHLVQGHTAEETRAPYRSALDAAIYEGCATVFEREYANVQALWGVYEDHEEAKLRIWQDALAAISPEQYYREPGVYNTWAFYDPNDMQRWKLYKVGTWLVDRALLKSGKDIRDFRTMTAAQIQSLL